MQKIDRAIEVLQAFKDGKTVEYCDNFTGWHKIDNLAELLDKLRSDECQIHIKQEQIMKTCDNCRRKNDYPKCYTRNGVACEDWLKMYKKKLRK